MVKDSDTLSIYGNSDVLCGNSGMNMHKRIMISLICALALLSVAFAGTSDDTSAFNKNPKLESLLTQMISSDDPQDFAITHGFSMENGNIRVVIEMYNETTILPGYIIEEIRQGNRVQAIVPIEKISTLSNEPDVIFIRLPSKPVVDTVNTTPADQTTNPKSGFDSAPLMIISIILIFLIKKKGEVIFDKK